MRTRLIGQMFFVLAACGTAGGLWGCETDSSGAVVEPAVTSAEGLGKLLFFDPRLSGDATLSCATCHQPARAFSDGRPMSAGYPGSEYFRNTPTIINASRLGLFYWDGRMSGDDLPSLVRDHISEAHFMHADGRLVIERLRQVPAYEAMFDSVYGGEPTYGRILKALAAFVTSIHSGESPWSRLKSGEEGALPPSAARGYALFKGKAKCATCHTGDLLTDGQLHDLGLGENEKLFALPERHITFRRFFRTLGISEYATLRMDVGHACVTKQRGDFGRFRTPSLLEVARTAPYMHDGRYTKLADVVKFYNHGGGKGNQALQPLHLSDVEQADLVAFLEALSSDLGGVGVPDVPGYETGEIPSRASLTATHPDTERSETIDNSEFPPLARLPAVPVPADNPVTDEKVELGKLLFFDDRLSGDLGTSCASCHDGRLGWGDGNALSRGYAGTQHWRNSQTLVNTGYLAKLFWAGESPSLEAQADSAIRGNVAGNGEPAMIEERLAQIPGYVRRFKSAFGVNTPTYMHALKAIATFERVAFNSTDSPFDEYLAGDTEAMSEGALRGLALFKGKANCIRCHNGPLMSDESYHSLGVPENPLFESDPLRQITLRFQHFSRGVPEPVYRSAATDLGLFYTTKQDQDRGKFRTPPLRYVEYTAPYMHNGAFETLEEVIDFYDEGGGDVANRSPWLQPLGLTEDEKFDLLDFLESLSGDQIRIAAPELPPYEAVIPAVN